MINKKDWIEYFPFETVRPQQEESINFILNSFINSNKKYTICEMPTGVGKSAVAITVSKYFENKVISDKKSSWILTTQKILQKQYQREFTWLPSVWSKSNYECKHHFGVSCTMGLWINKIFKNKYCDCIYTKDKNSFLENQISLTNIQFFLNHYEYRREDIKTRKLMVVDEAHNLEAAITDFVSVRLFKYNIIDYGITWINKYNSIIDVISYINNTLIPKLLAIKNKLEVNIKSSEMNSILSSPDGKLLIKRYDEIDKYICQLNRCTSRFNADEWVMTANNDGDEIVLKPLFANKFSQYQLFSAADKILLMSGTILDKNTFCRNIGIPVDDVAFISLPSPFDKENRPVFVVNCASLSYKNIDKSLPKISDTINKIISDHKNDKGIIHAHSYKIAHYIKKHIHTNRFLLHDESNRIEVYSFHLNSKTPTILLSPSFTEGIDLADEQSRFQIIVKVPYPYLGDIFIREKMNRIKGWYEWETTKTIIQASGRSVRNENDHCITYILDSDFIRFYNQNKNMFPKWYADSLIFI